MSLSEYKYFLVESDRNLVDCDDCGHTFAHRTCPPPEELTCPKCGFSSDPCDFPDTDVWIDLWSLENGGLR